MKKILALVLALCMIFALCACGQKAAPAEAPAAAPAAEPAAEPAEAPATEDDVIDVAVLVKSFDSQSWQIMLSGAEKAAADSNGKIKITTYGADSESDIEGQVAILENIIVSEPDAIVVTPSDSDALNAALDEAHAKGIKIVCVDVSVNTDSYDLFMANDNYAGGVIMAEQFMKYLGEAGIDPVGTVGVVSAVPVQTVYDRDDGFIDKLAELAPEIKVIRDQYVDNDMQKSMDLTNDFINSNEDLIGVYGDNNTTGSGIALALAEAGMQGKVIGVAYDGNDEEINGIRDGSLSAILVQDLWQWGYKGVNFAAELARGNDIGCANKFYNTGVTLVTLENIDSDEVLDVLDPSRLG
jgi:ABC-type sugar transport system, periplasmic component